MEVFSLPRLVLLAVAVTFVACSSSPEIRTSPRRGGDDSAETKRKKKKKKKKKKQKRVAERDEAPPPDEDEVRIIDDVDDEDEPAPKQKADKDDDEDSEVAARSSVFGSRSKKSKSKRSSDDEEDVSRRAKKKVKDDADEDEAPPPEDDEDDEAEVAAPAKKKPKKAKKKKPTVVAAKAKRPPKRERPAKAEPEVAEIELDTEPVEADEARSRRKPPTDEELIEMEAEDDPLATPRVAAIPVPGVDDEDEDEPEVEELPPGAWPMQIGDRPLVLAKDKLAAHAGLQVGVLTLPDATGTPQSTTSQSLTLGGTYGLGEKLEVGLDYALGISPGSVKGPLTLHGAYRATVKPKLEVAIAGGLAIDFFEAPGAMMGTTTTQTASSVLLGAWVRYRANRKLSVFSGVPATPTSPVSLSKLSFALPPLPYQLAFGLNSGGTRALDLPVGAGYQFRPNFYGLAMLNLAHIRIQNTQNAFLFKDFIPFVLGGFYTRKQLDVGVVFADDLKQGGDYLRLDLLVRYSIK